MANSLLFTDMKSKKDEVPKYTRAEAESVTERWNKVVELLRACGFDADSAPNEEGDEQ